MAHITYEFEELELIPGLDVWAFGYAEISGTAQGPEPDVGIMGGYYEWEVDAIYLCNRTEKGHTKLDPKHSIYELIETALHSDDYDQRISDQLAERDELDPDYYRD